MHAGGVIIEDLERETLLRLSLLLASFFGRTLGRQLRAVQELIGLCIDTACVAAVCLVN
jgi:hypothetical protein